MSMKIKKKKTQTFSLGSIPKIFLYSLAGWRVKIGNSVSRICNLSGERMLEGLSLLYLDFHLIPVFSKSSWFAVVKSLVRLCPTLCHPVDCSPPGSSVYGILQARILEWVAISFSRGSSWPKDGTQVSCIAGKHFNLWATREALIPVSLAHFI